MMKTSELEAIIKADGEHYITYPKGDEGKELRVCYTTGTIEAIISKKMPNSIWLSEFSNLKYDAALACLKYAYTPFEEREDPFENKFIIFLGYGFNPSVSGNVYSFYGNTKDDTVHMINSIGTGAVYRSSDIAFDRQDLDACYKKIKSKRLRKIAELGTMRFDEFRKEFGDDKNENE